MISGKIIIIILPIFMDIVMSIPIIYRVKFYPQGRIFTYVKGPGAGSSFISRDESPDLYIFVLIVNCTVYLFFILFFILFARHVYLN
jgi:lipoprotein signal peptidase